MGLFSIFSKSKYDDKKLTITAESAIKNHPFLKKETNVSAISEDGVVQIIGAVKSEKNKNKILKEVKKRLKSLNYERIEDNLTS
ncbi:hypothetical protein [Natronospora cellulosivora (SeqCode)]